MTGMLGASYRELGSIGLIVPPRCNETAIEEAMRIRPRGLAWCIASLGMDEFGTDQFTRALSQAKAAVRGLSAREVDVIAYTGMPLTSRRGATYHCDLRQALQEEAGPETPVQTDSGVVLEALRAVGARRVSIVTPYQAVTVGDVEHLLQEHGFEVAATRGRDLALAQLLTDVDDDSAFETACEAYEEAPETDAFFLSCPQWPVVGAIERLERATGKPVITQLQAILWWALATLGIDASPQQGGRLFAAAWSRA